MARFRLLSAAAPPALFEEVAVRLAADMRDDFCVVVSRAYLHRDLQAAVARHRGRQHASGDERQVWHGYPTMMVEHLVAHYARHLQHAEVLKPLQARQIITKIVRDLHAQSGGTMFAGQVVDGRVSEATLRALVKIFGELEPWALTPEEIREKLASGAAAGLSARAETIATVYRRYREHLAAKKVLGPLGQAAQAAALAATLPPPDGLRRFLFLGFDSYSEADVGVRLMRALASNGQHVDDVTLALVLPDDVFGPGWSTHGNADLLAAWQDIGGVRETVPTDAWLGNRHPTPEQQALGAMRSDPFAYRAAPVPAGGSLRAVRVPDTQLEIEWVAADIRRQLLASQLAVRAGTSNNRLRPEDIAVVARNMGDRAHDFEQALTRLGVPVVASRQQPVRESPAVEALLTLFRLPALGWRTADVVAAAESPYLGLGLNPTLLARAGSAGTMPTSPEEWTTRLARFAEEARRDELLFGAETIPTDAATQATELVQRFEKFLALIQETTGDGTRTPVEWRNALVQLANHCAGEKRIYDLAEFLSSLQQGECARGDLDGVNALLLAATEWLQGRTLADLPTDAPMSIGDWYQELEAIAAATTIRISSWSKDAVHLLDPGQASLREWSLVYVVGLVDGVFPARTKSDEHTLSDDERKLLALPTQDVRAARERMLFHMACAAADRELVLVTPAADDHGKALVPSPYLTYLPLRVAGFRVEPVTARSVMPTDAADVLAPRDLDLIAAERYRTLTRTPQPAAALAQAIRDDEVLRTWTAQGAARQTMQAWAVERLRASLDRSLTLAPDRVLTSPYRHYVGLLAPEDVPARVRSEEAAFTPAELATYGDCHFRYLATRVWHLASGPEREEDQDEAAAFSLLQQRILEQLYQELQRDGLLPPQRAADVTTALTRLAAIAQDAVRRFTASAHQQLWATDLEFVLDVLTQFVRRDLTELLDAGTNPLAPRLRTRPVAFQAALGLPSRPIVVRAHEETFRLRGTIDRLEAIDDPRAPQWAQGLMLVSSYRGSRSPHFPTLKQYLKGERLALPLYAVMAEEHMRQLADEGDTSCGSRVFGVLERRTSLPQDPELLGVRRVTPSAETGTLAFEHVQAPRGFAEFEKGNALGTVMDAALLAAGAHVRDARQGQFAPQPTRSCFGCHLKDICRSAKLARPDSRRQRGHMPVAVDAGAYADAVAAGDRPSPDADVPTAR